MQKIVPFLWFNDNAEEAINFYTSIFKDSKITKVTRYGDAGPGPKVHVDPSGASSSNATSPDDGTPDCASA